MRTDESLDRLLKRRSPATEPSRPPGSCLDAETLAAFAENALLSHERAAAEAHAAECERCLSVLAAIVKTTPPVEAAPRFRWLELRWLTPLATAAVAITAWVLVQNPAERTATPPTTTQAGSPSDAPQAGAASQGEGEKRESARLPDSVARDSRVNARAGAPAVSGRSGSRLEREAAAQESSAPMAKVAESDEGRALAADAFRKEARVAPRELPAAPEPGARAAASAPPSAPPPPARVEEKASVQSNEQRADASAPMARQLVAPVTIDTPDPAVRWRIVGSTVQRTTDGARSWQAQSTGTNVVLAAGSSPSPDVCWLVGRAGTILLSIDAGKSWRLLDFPERTADLVGVTASDGDTATVDTAEGRTYRTTDAGRTWRLQEPAPAPF